MPQSTRRKPRVKPTKPYPDFPLTPHPSGRWCKKVRGKLHYFGRLADPDAALKLWLDQKDYLLAGRTPPANLDGFTVRNLCNAFLTAKKHLVDAQELSPRSFADYYAVCDRLIKAFGPGRLVDDLAPADFDQLRASIAKVWGPVSLGNEINRIRVVFKYALDAGHIERAVRFGPGFKRPSRKTIRKARHDKGHRMLEAAEIRKRRSLISIAIGKRLFLEENLGGSPKAEAGAGSVVE